MLSCWFVIWFKCIHPRSCYSSKIEDLGCKNTQCICKSYLAFHKDVLKCLQYLVAAIVDKVRGMACVQRDTTKVAIEQGQQIDMEEHVEDHSNDDDINISLLSTNINQRALQMFKAIFSHSGRHTSSYTFTCIKNMILEEICNALEFQHLRTFEHLEQVDQEILKGFNISLENVVDESTKAIVVEISNIEKEYDFHEIALMLVEPNTKKMLEDYDTVMEQRPIQMGPTSALVELAKRNLVNLKSVEERYGSYSLHMCAIWY